MNRHTMAKLGFLICLILPAAFFAALSGWFLPLPAQAAPEHYNSVIHVIVDTALADRRDAVELEVMVYSSGEGPVTSAQLFGASSRPDDNISVGRNAGGYYDVKITSSSPGASQIAISLASRDAAAKYLRGEIGDDEARIIQTDKGQDIFTVFFISGALDVEYCEMEFDKDTIAVMDNRFSDNAVGTVWLRTSIDQPVANQRVTIYSNAPGIMLYPSRTSEGNYGQGSSITLTTERNGSASFVVRGYVLGDAEIVCNVDGQEFSENIIVDLAENVFDLGGDDWDDWDDEDDEEPPPVISLEHTIVSLSKPIGYEYGSNARFGISTAEIGRDKIIISGVAMSADDEPIREQHLVHAYVTTGSLDKTTTLTTSSGGAFSFSLTSRNVCMGRYAVGLGSEEQLKAYLEGRISAAACRLLKAGTFSFISRDWNKYMLCAIDDTKATINGYSVDLDVAPFIQNGRTMLTARPIADTVGAVSNWNQATQTASFYITSRNYTVSTKIGSIYIDRTERYVQPKQYISDVPSMIRDGRTVLPLRAIAESFEMMTEYDAEQQLVAIYNVNPYYKYSPRRDPNSPEYDPVVDPDNELYNARKDPDSPFYDPYVDPRNPRYDASRDPDSKSYDPKKDPYSSAFEGY